MSPQVIGPIIGLALLMVLIPVAVYQRRTAVADPLSTSPELAGNEVVPRSPGPAIRSTHAPSARNSLTTGQVALGVFLGLWMFALSCGILTFAFMIAVSRSLVGR